MTVNMYVSDYKSRPTDPLFRTYYIFSFALNIVMSKNITYVLHVSNFLLSSQIRVLAQKTTTVYCPVRQFHYLTYAMIFMTVQTQTMRDFVTSGIIHSAVYIVFSVN